MKFISTTLCTAVMVLLSAVSVNVNADELKTIDPFASNNGGNIGGMVYFDLTVGASDVSITALTTNTGATTAFNDLSVFTLLGGSVGNETNAALWGAASATGSGTGAGSDLVTAVSLDSPFVLLAGNTYGIAIGGSAVVDHDYTNGTGGNQNFADANISLALGTASNVPFTAGIFSPRVWNGSIIYDVVGVPEPASITFLGLAAMGLVVRRRR